jgi:type I restriction enzyme S subunit
MLEEVFDIRNGYTPSKANKYFWTDGVIPWFRMEDIRVNGRILPDSIQHITAEAIKGKLFPADSIIIATTATIGEHALLTVDSLANQRFTCLTRNTNHLKSIDPMFAFYYCFKLGEWCRENINVSNFPSVDMGKFRKFPFPIPSLSEQKRIVNILDKFSVLVNDIAIGLPAEINMRCQQYEYYRNKLLTFNKHTKGKCSI